MQPAASIVARLSAVGWRSAAGRDPFNERLNGQRLCKNRDGKKAGKYLPARFLLPCSPRVFADLHPELPGGRSQTKTLLIPKMKKPLFNRFTG